MASTTLNPLFKASRETVSKHQKNVRKALGLGDPPTGQLSSGRYRIDPSPVVLGLQASLRFSPDDANTLCQAFLEAGFDRLIADYKVDEMSKDITHRVKDHLILETKALKGRFHLGQVPPQMRINNAIQAVVLANQEFKTYARDYSAVCDRVEAALPQITRQAGSMERLEQGYALGEVNVAAEEWAPRKFDVMTACHAGIEAGESMVVYQQSWAPDTQCQLLQPAFIDMDDRIDIKEVGGVADQAIEF